VFDPHAEGRWSLHRVERAPAGVLWAGEKHLRLFDDHLGLAPAPRGALTPADAVARVEALPTWALTCGTLSPADLETIFDRVTDPSR
jgi:hypothetical protein